MKRKTKLARTDLKAYWQQWHKENESYKQARGQKTADAFRGSYRNILKVYEESTLEQRNRGLSFYEDARSQAYDIGKSLGYIGSNAVRQGAGIIAVLSPRTDWDNNIKFAQNIVNQNFVYQTERDKAKATRIMEGDDPMDVMGRHSHKTKAFYQALVNPLGRNEVYDLIGYTGKAYLAVVDRHAGGVFKGQPLSKEHREKLREWRINRRVSNAYFRASRKLNIPVNDVQAITWVTFRDMYKNMKLYRTTSDNKQRLKDGALQRVAISMAKDSK